MPKSDGYKNLIPPVKGEIRNPKGRPPGVENSSKRLLRLLALIQSKKNTVTGEMEDFTVAEQMDMKQIGKALNGNISAYREILDRLEGKPNQSIKTEGILEMNIVWQEEKTYEANTKAD